jgi:hypothetical protein
MKNESNSLLAGAFAGLVLLSGAAVAETKGTATETVMCHGVNACKGQGSCAGKVDACSGKNGCSAEVTCAGHNSCKGKGLVKLPKQDCLAKGGKVASK